MFNSLMSLIPSDGTPALENGEIPETRPSAQSPTAAPPPPPTRFGATQIVLEIDPSQPVICIHETTNMDGYHDYTVFINREICGDGNYYAEFITLLKSLTAKSNVTIYIGSPGGSLNAGAMIANAIRRCAAPVTTVAIGIVASAAALIWSYGHIRKVSNGSGIMFHMSSHHDYGNSEAIRIQAENTVRYVKEVCIDPLVMEHLLTAAEAEIIIDQRRDFWLDSDTLNARLEKIHA